MAPGRQTSGGLFVYSATLFHNEKKYSVEIWRKIAQLVAANWVYDMADNIAFAKRVQVGESLDRINTEWGRH
jgi:hypothetical protein